RTRVSQENQVDVRAVVQLLPAKLAHGDDGQPLRRDSCLGVGMVEACLNQGVGQERQLDGHAAQIEQSKKVARSNSQQFPPLKAAQRVELLFGVVNADHHPLGLNAELLHALQLGQPFVLCQPVEMGRRAQQNLGQELAADKQPHEDFDGARIVAQASKQNDPVGDALCEAFEVDQCLVGLGRVG